MKTKTIKKPRKLRTLRTNTYIDRSGTTTAGTNLVAAAANLNRNFFQYQNTSDTDHWLNFGAAAAVGIGFKILPGQYYPGGDSGSAPGESINVFCASAGKTFCCKEY